ncbi:MAG TPA: hypothetical protein DCY20_02055, partial [Firmicutes bacterium]|nr:hypothetical protein [Bacillota bacterium]
MIITTSFDETAGLVEKAKALAKKYQLTYVKRNKKTIKYLQKNVDPNVFVVNSKRGLSYYPAEGEEVFFHPNMAFHRITAVENLKKDGLVTACNLHEGSTLLDCTLGLASDTLLASFVVGESGRVISIEKSIPLSILVREGLNHYVRIEKPEWGALLERIQIVNEDNLTYLKSLPDNHVDVVYFDFMFNKTVESSQGIKVIKPLVSYDCLTFEHVLEARRVAKSRVVVKSNYGNQSI